MKNESRRYTLEESIAHLAARFYRAIMKHINRELSKEGLRITLEQWPLLIHVWDQDGLSQSDLARRLFKDKTTIARLAAGIESSGMIERNRSEKDKRGKSLHLTKRGKAIMDKATAMVLRIDDMAVSGIDEGELKICKDVLRRAHKNLSLLIIAYILILCA
jgi:MarR family transcriptional regulator, organic hydroperoxide resistance regulator